MNLHPPETRIANRYEVAGKPLFGGMGLVYLCYDHQGQHPVALKTFRPEFLPDRAVRDRFLREGDTWVQLGRHPHVVRCYGVERIGDGREVYLILELVARDTTQERRDASLRSWLRPGRPLPLETSLLFAIQIARGMQHTTEVLPGFVHRDLKPENLLVGADKMHGSEVNRLRVTDFGLASILADLGSELDLSESDTKTSHPTRTKLTHGIAGTPLYMAPEQWRGKPLTAAADIYAFGCILYEMLSGRLAVKPEHTEQVMQAHLVGNIEPLPSDLPEPVRALVNNCLAKHTEKRPGSWADILQWVAHTLEQEIGRAVPAAADAAELSREERVAAGWAKNSLGASYLDIGKATEAKNYFDQVRAAGEAEGELGLISTGLGNLGNAYFHLGDARRAIDYHEQALAISREIGDRHGEGANLGNLGIAYLQLGDARRAIEYHEQALAISREIGDRHGEGNVLGNLGNAHLQLGDARRAIDYYEQALAIRREIGYRHSEGINLGSLGIAYFQLGDARRAIDYYEQALAILQESGDRYGEGSALGNLGNAYYQLGDTRRAIDYYEQALAIRREIDDRHGEANNLGNLGLAYRQLGDTRRAIDYHEQALAIYREIGDPHGEGGALNNLGIAYRQLGDARRAIDYHEQALDIYREIGDRYGEGYILNGLGTAYLQLSDARRAIDYYEQAVAVRREIGDRHGEGNDLGSLGIAYVQLGDARKAIEYHEQALAIHRETGDRHGEGNNLGNLGTAYAQLGDARPAIEYYEQALAIHRESGHLFSVATESFNLALAYAREGDTLRARPLAEESAALFRQIGHQERALQAEQLVSQLGNLSSGKAAPAASKVLESFQPFIEAVVAAVHGDRMARSAVESHFESLRTNGWQIVEPIKRIWSGERDEAALTVGIDPNSAAVLREILRRL